MSGIVHGELGRAEHGRPRVPFRRRAKLGKPVWPRPRVGIERGDPRAGAALGSEIGCGGKADIVARMSDVKAIVRKPQAGNRVNRGRVVDDHRLESRHGLRCKRIDASLQQGACVVVDDDDADPRACRRSSLRHSTGCIEARTVTVSATFQPIAICASLEFRKSAATNSLVPQSVPWAWHVTSLNLAFASTPAGQAQRSRADCRPCRSGDSADRPRSSFYYVPVSFALLNPFLRRSDMRQVHAGLEQVRNGRYAIYVLWQPAGTIPWYVRNLLEALREQEVNTIAVVNHELSAEQLSILQGLCAEVLVRGNKGSDFGAYKDAVLRLTRDEQARFPPAAPQ